MKPTARAPSQASRKAPQIRTITLSGKRYPLEEEEACREGIHVSTLPPSYSLFLLFEKEALFYF